MDNPLTSRVQTGAHGRLPEPKAGVVFLERIGFKVVAVFMNQFKVPLWFICFDNIVEPGGGAEIRVHPPLAL